MVSSPPALSVDHPSHAEKTALPASDVAERPSTPVVQEPVPEWKLGRQETLIMVALMVVSLTAALDTTVLVPDLPVSNPRHPSI